jgi:hypothetical protein
MSMKNSWSIEVALLAVCSVKLSAQQYSISMIAGGVPPSTPSLAGNASISPDQVATDSNGNVFSSSNNSVFEIDPTDLLAQIAGNSRVGCRGDGGSALDGSQRLITSKFVIRKVSPSEIRQLPGIIQLALRTATSAGPH